MEADLSLLEKRISISFKNEKMLRTAFTHRSYLNEHPAEKLENNERLEFLGDSVLGLIVSRHLFESYPNSSEGELTNYRSSLVNAKTLAKAASSLGLGEFLYLSRGEEATGGRERQYLLANTFEALIGAIFVDLGFEKATQFVERFLLPDLAEIIEKKLYKDFKSVLQEKAQEKYSITPNYKIIEETGPDHSKTFKTAVFLGSKRLAEGVGNSKQLAEQEAARRALEKWR
jgi:ribonuclease-3